MPYPTNATAIAAPTPLLGHVHRKGQAAFDVDVDVVGPPVYDPGLRPSSSSSIGCIRLTLDRTSRSCCNGRVVDVIVVVDAVFHGSDDRCFERRTKSSTASSASDVARDRRCNSCIVVVSAAAVDDDDDDDADSPPEGAYRRTGLIAPASAAAATVVNGRSSTSMWKLTRWERCGGGVGRIGRGGLHPIGKRRPIVVVIVVIVVVVLRSSTTDAAGRSWSLPRSSVHVVIVVDGSGDVMYCWRRRRRRRQVVNFSYLTLPTRIFPQIPTAYVGVR